MRALKRAPADTNTDLALERQYVRLACERAGIPDVGEFKKRQMGRCPWGRRAGWGAAGVNVSGVCRKLGMSRQNYYARPQQRQRRQVDGELVAQLVRAERAQQSRI